MEIRFDFITGIALGCEFVSAEECEDRNTIILDLFIVRVLFQWD